MIIRLRFYIQPNSHSVPWQDEGVFGCAQTWYFYLLERRPGDGWRWGAPKIGDFTGKEEVRDLPQTAAAMIYPPGGPRPKRKGADRI